MPKYTPIKEKVDSKAGFFFLMLYTLFVFTRPHEWSPTGFDFPYIRIILIIAFFFFLVQQKPKNFQLPSVAMIGIVLVTVLSGISNAWLTGGIIVAIGFVVSAVIPYLLFTSLLYDEERVRSIMKVALVGAMIMFAHGMSQVMSPIGMGWSGEYLSQGTRITFLGIFNDPNDLGMFLLICIPLATYFFKSSTSFFIKFLMIIVLFCLFFGIYKTNSRGTLVGVLSLFALYSYFRFGKVKSILMGVVAVPAALFAMSMFRQIDSEEDSAGQRIEAWYTAIDLFQMKPVFGVGMRNFTEYHDLTAHNSYALVLSELGGTGYILWFIVTVFPLVKLFEIMKNKLIVREDMAEQWEQRYKNTQLLAATFFYSMIGFLATAFFISRSYSTVWVFIVSLATAYVFLIDNTYVARENTKLSNRKMIVKIAGLAFCSLIGFYLIVRILL